MSLRSRIGLTALAAILPFVSTVHAQKIAVKAGRVITMDGEPIENGVILIDGGRITAVGPAADVEVPWDAVVHDHPDLTAFPGFVEAHTNRGMDRSNENIDVAPFLDIRDSIDPVNFFFEDALRSGITTINVQQGADCVIGGQGMVVKPYGMTVEEMLVRPGSGVKMSAAPKSGKSRATQAQALRGAFGDLRRYLEDLVQDAKDGKDDARREALYQGRDLEGENGKGRAMEGAAWKVEGLEIVPRGEVDEKQEPLLHIVEGRMPVWIHCNAPMDVALAIEVSRQNGFLSQTTLVLEGPCWKAADMIAAAGLSVVLPDDLVHIERDPITGEEIETFLPQVFHDKGIQFALQSQNASTQSLWYQAARTIGLGLDRADALAAVTTTPAEMLRLGDRVGKFAAGFDGNVVLFSGDPLSVTSFVEYVVLDGALVYDRSKDVRAQHLIEGIEPANTMAEGLDEESEVDPHSGEGPPDEEGDEDSDEGEDK